MVGQIVQVIGSLLVLGGFVAAQRGWTSTRSMTYLLLNVAGSSILAVEALLGRQWGFLLLEGAWALVSGVGVVTLLGRRPTPPDAAGPQPSAR